MSVSPDTKFLTHDLSLTDGTNTVNLLLSDRKGNLDPGGWQAAYNPRSTMKMSTGPSGYGDYELPFSPFVQNEFMAGRGNRDFETDGTRYGDGYAIDTARSREIRCGPLATQSGKPNWSQAGDTYAGISTNGGDWCYASFTPGFAITPATVYEMSIYAQFIRTSVWTPTYINVILALFQDNSGAPGTEICRVNIPAPVISRIGSIYSTAGQLWTLPVPGSSFANGTIYWVGLYMESGGGGLGQITCHRKTSGVTGRSIYKGATLVLNNASFALTLKTYGSGRSILFNYRNRMMAVTQPDTAGAAPTLWINGYHGMATDNSSDKSKLNTTLDISEDLSGKYVMIVGGPGNMEETNWRIIVSNTTGASAILTVSPSWNVTHTTSTEFVVLGCDSWQQIKDSGTTDPPTDPITIHDMTSVLSSAVTDVLVVDDVIYFAMGESVNIARTRFNAGLWATMTADGTNKATYLALVQDDTGKERVWAAQAAAATVQEADKVAWGTSLTFAATLVCGTTTSRITNLRPGKLGAGGMMPIIHKEDGFGAIAGTGAKKIFDWYRYFPEMKSANNGRAALQHDMYWWFSLLEGVERYYDQRLDDIGPNRDEGLPSLRRGEISCIIEYASQVFIGIDAGKYGTSCVMRYNGLGWNEVYRSSVFGARIRGLGIQVIPGFAAADRLWISVEEDVYWVPLSLNPDQQSDYKYQTGTAGTADTPSSWESSWIYGNFRDLKKYWDSLTIFAENLSSTVYVAAYYKVDADSTWTAIGNFTSGPAQELPISSAYNTVGRRIKIRLVLVTGSTSVSPIVSAIRINAVVRVKPKAIWSFTALISDGPTADKQHVLVEGDVDAYLDQMVDWQDGTLWPAPLTMSHYHKLLDGKHVFLDGVSASPIKVEIAPGLSALTMLVSGSLIEV